jgi:Lar family restriction alleviation protein
MTDAELKPCPFCGSRSVLKNNKYNYGGSGYFVKCANEKCGAQLSEVDCLFSSSIGSQKTKAVDNWNNRV